VVLPGIARGNRNERKQEMTRKLKILGLTLLAIFAMGALAASPAFAESFAFHSASSHTTLLGAGVGTEKFIVDGGSVTCEGTDYEGTASGEELAEVTVVPKFKSCKLGAFTSTVTVNSCKYVLAPVTKKEGTYKAKLSLSCSGGDSIKVVATAFGTTKCTVHFPPQELGEVTVSEVSEDDIKVVADIENIMYSQTSGTGLGFCPKAEGTANGSYEGETVVAGVFEGYDVPIGMEAFKPTIDVKPAETSFKVNEKTDIEVINESGGKILILLAEANKNYFKTVAGTDKCTNQQIDKGGSCKVKIECTKAVPGGAFVSFEAISDNPRDFDGAILKCS
jgi:hypothetical protein